MAAERGHGPLTKLDRRDTCESFVAVRGSRVGAIRGLVVLRLRAGVELGGDDPGRAITVAMTGEADAE